MSSETRWGGGLLALGAGLTFVCIVVLTLGYERPEGGRLTQGLERDLERAYELLTRSVRSFPDSPVAGAAHRLRADILDAWDRGGEAAEARRRVREFYAGG